MIRSRQRNRFDKTRSDKNWSIYKAQRNFCTKLFRKTKKDYFSKANPNIYRTMKAFGELLDRIYQTKETFLTAE